MLLAVEHEPALVEAWYNLAHIQQQQGDWPAACESLRRAVAEAPDYADAHFNLALVLEKSGHHREALPHWRAYLALDGTSEWAHTARQHLMP